MGMNRCVALIYELMRWLIDSVKLLLSHVIKSLIGWFVLFYCRILNHLKTVISSISGWRIHSPRNATSVGRNLPPFGDGGIVVCVGRFSADDVRIWKWMDTCWAIRERCACAVSARKSSWVGRVTLSQLLPQPGAIPMRQRLGERAVRRFWEGTRWVALWDLSKAATSKHS